MQVASAIAVRRDPHNSREKAQAEAFGCFDERR